MNELHLFAGIGGGILGGLLCGHRCVCAVELDPYCRSVLVQRQNDGVRDGLPHLPPFPIWDDIRTFDGRPWRGVVDVVSGGFPCQNISPAGDGTGIAGEQSSLWFEMLRVIREVRPEYVFVENSAFLVRRGLDVVLGSLDESGYDAEWCVLGADDVGANHRRKRCWILGRNTDYKIKSAVGKMEKKKPVVGRIYQNVPDTNGQRQPQPQGVVEEQRRWIGDVRQEIPDTENGGIMRRNGEFSATETTDGVWCDYGGGTPEYGTREWWKVEPRIRRISDGCSHRLERLKGLGNAQVPLCAAVAWRILYENFNSEGRNQ